MNTARSILVLSFVSSFALPGCGAATKSVPATAPPANADADAIPTLRLPADTHPEKQALTLTIDPEQARFSGKTDITIVLDRPRSVLWLHGKGLDVRRATVTPMIGSAVSGTWKQRDATGIAELVLSQTVPAGRATLQIEYDAPFGPTLEGLHKVVQAKVPYAFTQFESIAARTAFPCFDEPSYKIPWDTTLVIPVGSNAIANTREIDRKIDGASQRIHFATTLPLPSYLVAFAVGRLEIIVAPDVPPNAVRKRPLPLRAITASGRGNEVVYALAHTGEILSAIEQYVGIEYPYDKLDILAVPDKGGAMENPGAVTFAEALLLFDENSAPLAQKRAYARVMAHELAHMWVGDLVTAAWWDDIWLNEAFATWIGTKGADAWNPKIDAATDQLGGVQNAIGSDSLVSSRAIRQPIVSTNDIENAFDVITYQKGGGVLSMFERWVGPEIFQRGLKDYLTKHRFRAATADDFLGAVSKASGKDVQAPFHTFLDQPGVPFVEADVRCDGSPRIHLKQSRFLPLGSSGDTNRTWQIPICARYQVGKLAKEACTLLTDKEGDLPLGDTCPDWVFPNAGAAGYFRYSLAAADLTKLRERGYALLTGRERVAYGNGLRAAFSRGTLPMKTVIEAAAPLASDSHRSVAEEPMSLIGVARDWLYTDPLRAQIEAYARKLFHAQYVKLGWQPAKNEDGDRTQLRTSIFSFLAFTARDPVVRAEARKRGLAFLGGKDGALRPDAVDPNLLAIALGVAGEEADRPLWDAIRARLAKTVDAELRRKLLGALVSAKKAELLPLVRELAFDPSLRPTEVTAPIWSQLQDPALRDSTWEWAKTNFDRILAVVPKHHGQTQIISMGGVFCDEAHAKDAEAFFTTARLGLIDGGPRVLASTLEGVRLCAARREKQEPSAREMFGKSR